MTPPRSQAGRRADAGITLVEVLVVLALIGTVAGLAGLSLGSLRPGADARQEARLLAARLHRAADEALVGDGPAALVWSERAYRFDLFRDGAWVAHPVAVLGTPHDLGAGLRLVGPEPEGHRVLTADLPPPEGGPLRIGIVADGAGEDAVAVTFDGVSALVAGEGA